MDDPKELLNISGADEGANNYSVVVSQYLRSNYYLGDEEKFHWALIVLTQFKEQIGPLWQAVNYIVPTTGGQGVEVWRIDSQNATLWKTTKCMGGVIIGRINPDEMDDFSKVISAIQPPSKADRPEWRCHSFVMDAIELLIPKGWADPSITSQDALLPSLKKASAATDEKMRNTGGQAKPVIVPLGL